MRAIRLSSEELAYERIRHSRTDVGAIARNTGYKAANIAKIKDHLFHARHLLDKYVTYGVPAEYARFDPDQNIADSWSRLVAGKYMTEDLALLQHEMAEAWYMRKIDRSYCAAHNAAGKHFPAPEW